METIINKKSKLIPGLSELWIVFAHPDDEALFFYQAIQWLKPKKLHLICANTLLGKETEVRNAELIKSASGLKAKLSRLEMSSDEAKHLDIDILKLKLKSLNHRPGIPVLSHGVLGEYAHVAHIDVFKAAFQIFSNDLWIISGPLYPDITLNPDSKELMKQMDFISSIYLSQKTVWNWAPRQINLTHISTHNFAPAVSGTQNPKEFLSMLKDNYQNSKKDLPLEARQVAVNWDIHQLKSRIDQCISEWEMVFGIR